MEVNKHKQYNGIEYLFYFLYNKQQLTSSLTVHTFTISPNYLDKSTKQYIHVAVKEFIGI